jgi:hypothetical protein
MTLAEFAYPRCQPIAYPRCNKPPKNYGMLLALIPGPGKARAAAIGPP